MFRFVSETEVGVFRLCRDIVDLWRRKFKVGVFNKRKTWCMAPTPTLFFRISTKATQNASISSLVYTLYRMLSAAFPKKNPVSWLWIEHIDCPNLSFLVTKKAPDTPLTDLCFLCGNADDLFLRRVCVKEKGRSHLWSLARGDLISLLTSERQHTCGAFVIVIAALASYW